MKKHWLPLLAACAGACASSSATSRNDGFRQIAHESSALIRQLEFCYADRLIDGNQLFERMSATIEIEPYGKRTVSTSGNLGPDMKACLEHVLGTIPLPREGREFSLEVLFHLGDRDCGPPEVAARCLSEPFSPYTTLSYHRQQRRVSTVVWYVRNEG
ncbi:MAG: hypothetical protein HY698_10875 [Deltaproteobacteria bacterium]|nr:hypothetical protein [Deltaproteobacteria bacterium]